MQRNFFFKTLELENFMIFTHKVVNFAEDLSLVIGRNGSGKSAILDALALSFQIKERTSSVQNYIRYNQTTAKLKLTSSWMNKDLVIESIFNTKGSRRIQRIVTYDGKQYEDTIANNFLSEFFDNNVITVSFALQGAEKFLTNSKATNLKNMINLLQLDFSKEVEYSKNQTQSLDKIKTEALNLINRQQGSKETLHSSLTSYKEKLSQLLEVEKTLLNTDTNTDSIDSEVISLKSELQKLLEIQNSLTEKQNTCSQLKQQIDKSTIDLQKVENQLQQLPNLEIQNLDLFKDRSQTITNNISDLTIRLNEIVNKISEFNINLANSKTTHDIEHERFLKLQSGICPTCSQKIASTITSDLDNKVKSLVEDINRFKETITDLQKNKSDIETQLRQDNQTLQQNQNDLQKAELNNHTKENNDKLRTALVDSKQQLTDNLKDLQSRYNDAITDFEKHNVDNNQKILEYQNNIQNLETQKKSILDLYTKKQSTQVEIQSCKNSIQQIERQLQDIEVIEKTETDKLQETQTSIGTWQKTQDVFGLLPKLYLKHFIKDIQDICSKIIIGFGYSGLHIESDEKGISFYLLRMIPDTTEQIQVPYEMCSAFERNLINLALIYTLTRMFRTPFVCIDELDATADIENTQRLGELIRMIIQHTPVITVSHDTNLVNNLSISNFEVSIIKTEEDA